MISLEETFKRKRDVDLYIEKWEKIRSESDPLIQKWEEYIKKSKEKTK